MLLISMQASFPLIFGRSLTEMKEYLDDTTVKQTRARDQLQEYVDSLMGRAERAEIAALNASQSEVIIIKLEEGRGIRGDEGDIIRK